MTKIAIIGSSGSGKSTFANRLQKKLCFPLYHLDLLYWKPNWVRTPRLDWIQLQESIVKESAWIIDGNYGGTLDIRLRAADTIIFLKFSRIPCLWGVFKRFISRKRIDEIPGCKEKLDPEFIKWIWNYNKKNAPGILKKLRELSTEKSIYVFNNRRQLDSFYNSLSRGCQNI